RLENSAIGPHLRLDLPGARQVGAAYLDGARLPGRDKRMDLGDRSADRRAHPITFGTLKRPASASGAFLRASSRGMAPWTRSSRRARDPTGMCDVASTPDVSRRFS